MYVITCLKSLVTRIRVCVIICKLIPFAKLKLPHFWKVFNRISTGFWGNSIGFWRNSTGFWRNSTGFWENSTGFWGNSTGFWENSTGFRGYSTGFRGNSTGFWGNSTEVFPDNLNLAFYIVLWLGFELMFLKVNWLHRAFKSSADASYREGYTLLALALVEVFKSPSKIGLAAKWFLWRVVLHTSTHKLS